MRTNGGTQSLDIAAGYLLNLLYLFTVISYYCQMKQGVCLAFQNNYYSYSIFSLLHHLLLT